MAVALAALDATIRVAGPDGERTIPIADYHRLPGDTPEIDTTLKTGEIVLSIDLPADDFFFPYVEPQETGNRTETFWVTFTDAAGKGIRVTGDPKINFSILPYTMGELETRKHPWELNACGNWVINVDYGQMGLAGEDSWGARPWPEYQLPPGREYSYGFVLEPVK